MSQELISIHIHRDDDILGEGELFQHPAEVPREAEDGACAEHEVEAEVAVAFLQRRGRGVAEGGVRRERVVLRPSCQN